jgi:hypothetical protein
MGNIIQKAFTAIISAIFANRLNDRLGGIVSKIDEKEAQKAADKINNSLSDLEKSRSYFCKHRPEHHLCRDIKEVTRFKSKWGK